MPLFCYRVVGNEQGRHHMIYYFIASTVVASANFDALAEYVIVELHSIM